MMETTLGNGLLLLLPPPARPQQPSLLIRMNRILFSKSETTKTIITEHLVTKKRLKQEAAHYHTSITAHLTTIRSRERNLPKAT